MRERWFEYVWDVVWPWTFSGHWQTNVFAKCTAILQRKSCCQELLLCIQLPRKNLTAVKELAHILATKDLYQKFPSICVDKGYWRLPRQDAERVLQTLEKGGPIFEFEEIEDQEEEEEQQRLSKLWEQYCQELEFDIEKTRYQGRRAWVARPRPSQTTERKRFVFELQTYMKVLEAYEFAEGSPDKALLLQRCVEELKQTFRKSGKICHIWQNLETFAFRIQEHLQTQSVSTLQSLSTFLVHDIDALVTSSPSRYIVWEWVNEPPRASEIGDRFHMITWCTWIKSMVDEILAIRLAADNHQHHHELKGLLQEVCSELKKSHAKDAAPNTDAADVLSDASWVQVRSEIASIPESSDSSTSGISVETFGCPCFMTDSVFKAPDGSFVSSQQLVKGSKVLGFDGSILTVKNPPEQHQARATVILHAAGAKLQVTPDHRIVLATSPPAFWWEDMQTIWYFSFTFAIECII